MCARISRKLAWFGDGGCERPVSAVEWLVVLCEVLLGVYLQGWSCGVAEQVGSEPEKQGK